MAMNLDKMVSTLNKIENYHGLFKAAFPKSKGNIISKEKVAKAIATYERTIVSSDYPFDHWIKGNEKAISASAKRGFILFNKKALALAKQNASRLKT